jgi:hypothetical protein
MVAPGFEKRGPTHAKSHPLQHDHRLLEVGFVSGMERPGQRCDDDEIPGP